MTNPRGARPWSGIGHAGLMSAFVFRFKMCPYPTFTLDMSDQEREIMACHAENWRPWPSEARW